MLSWSNYNTASNLYIRHFISIYHSTCLFNREPPYGIYIIMTLNHWFESLPRPASAKQKQCIRTDWSLSGCMGGWTMECGQIWAWHTWLETENTMSVTILRIVNNRQLLLSTSNMIHNPLSFLMNPLPRPGFCEAEAAYTRRLEEMGWAWRCNGIDLWPRPRQADSVEVETLYMLQVSRIVNSRQLLLSTSLT
jgi:hypothetical protein